METSNINDEHKILLICVLCSLKIFSNIVKLFPIHILFYIIITLKLFNLFNNILGKF